MSKRRITGLSLISVDIGEEAPLGFEIISRTPGSHDANLTYGSRFGIKDRNINNDSSSLRSSSSRSRQVFLCIYRGDGPSITDIGIDNKNNSSKLLSIGWHEINRKPNGDSPNLNDGEIMLFYKRDYKTFIFNKFEKYQKTGNEKDMLIAQCIACLVCGVYSYDRKTFLRSLEAFTSLDSIEKDSKDSKDRKDGVFPNGIITDFINVVKDAVTSYISCNSFDSEVYRKVLQWLGHVYTIHYKSLDTSGFMSMLHLCMFLRHEDVREEIGKFLLQNVSKHSKVRCKTMYECENVRFKIGKWDW